MNNPLVSILMTSFNREKYIAEAIESVLSSTYQNFELIIVDDGSSDNTQAIAKFYQKKDNRIKLYFNEENLGDYINRNKAASYAKGKYIKYLDSDDIIFSWGLKIMIDCMEKYPEAGLGVVTNVNFNIIYPKCIDPIKIYRLYFYRSALLTAGPTGAIIRKEVFDAYGGFSGKKYVGDTALWLHISQKHSLVIIPPGQIYWREHDGQQISEERKNFSVEAVRHELNESILNDTDCPLPPQETATILRNLRNIKCRNIIETGLKGNFIQALKSIKYLKLNLKDFLLALKKNKVPSESFLQL